MSTLFVSVDVETTGPAPVVADLLTLGAVPVLEDGTVLEAEGFYCRISYGGRPLRWESQCHAWWHSEAVSDEARRLAFGILAVEETVDVSRPAGAAVQLETWVLRQKALRGASDVCFVAHPAGFDWQFVNALLWEQLGHNPFGYRSLCLRSMGFGLSGRPWGEDRTDDSDLYVPSKVPHHALHDAIAQAHQLSRMLRLRGAL